MEMLSVKIVAQMWGVSTRRIGQLCNAGEIEGAVKIGGLWKIPNDAQKPAILRKKKVQNVDQQHRFFPVRSASLPTKKSHPSATM